MLGVLVGVIFHLSSSKSVAAGLHSCLFYTLTSGSMSSG